MHLKIVCQDGELAVCCTSGTDFNYLLGEMLASERTATIITRLELHAPHHQNILPSNIHPLHTSLPVAEVNRDITLQNS